jgi:hypothetical protein
MAAAPSSPEELLRGINFDLVHNDPMQDVCQRLEACQDVLAAWHQTQSGPAQMTIYPKPAAYTNANQRTQSFALYRERNPPGDGVVYTDEEWKEEELAFGVIGDAVHPAHQRGYVIYVTAFQNLVFSHSWNVKHFGMPDTPANRAKFYERDNMWHEVVLLLRQRTVYLYDPSFVPQAPGAPKRQLKDLPMCGTKATAIVSALRKRGLKVEHVVVGGGENMGRIVGSIAWAGWSGWSRQ